MNSASSDDPAAPVAGRPGAESADVAAPALRLVGPVKRSITIAGHATSISLEPVFWAALQARARADGLPLSALVARVDALRIGQPRPPNLASALRTWLFATNRDKNENVSQ